MQKSNFLSLNARDFFKGLVMVLITALITGIYQLLEAGTVFTWETIKPVLITSATAALGYLIKNLLTNSAGEMLTTEKSQLAIKLKNGGKLTKILILGLFLSGTGLISSAQNKFFAPVPKDLLTNTSYYYKAATLQKDVWLFRPSMQVTAIQLNYDRVTRGWTPEPFKSFGAGVSYQHFIDMYGGAVTNYGFTAFVMFDASGVSTILKPAVAFTLLQLGSFGVEYDTALNKVCPFIGISYSFN